MVTKPTKYTKAFVDGELASILTEVLSDQSIVFIGQIFERRSYSRQRYSEWAEKFKDDEQITDAIKKIDELIETRLVTGALGKELNPVITIFTLKNKHGWKDVSGREHSGPGGDPIESTTSVTYYPKGLPENYWNAATTDQANSDS